MTVDGVTFPIIGASLEEPLVEGELARFVVVASNDSYVCPRGTKVLSPKRAVADCASKIAFFLRRRAGGGLRFNDLWVRSAGPANEKRVVWQLCAGDGRLPSRVSRPGKSASSAAAARRRTWVARAASASTPFLERTSSGTWSRVLVRPREVDLRLFPCLHGLGVPRRAEAPLVAGHNLRGE